MLIWARQALKRWPWLEEKYEGGWPLDIYIKTRFRRPQGAQSSMRGNYGEKTEENEEDKDMKTRFRRPPVPPGWTRFNYREETDEDEDDEDDEDELASDDGVPSAGTSSAPSGHAAGASTSSGGPAMAANDTSRGASAWVDHMRIRGQRAVNVRKLLSMQTARC